MLHERFGFKVKIVGQKQTAHSILGLSSESASKSEVKAAYRKLALKYHPDRAPHNEAKFLAVQEAYEELVKPETTRASATSQTSRASTRKTDFDEYERTTYRPPPGDDVMPPHKFFPVVFGTMFAMYNIALFGRIKKYADPNGTLSLGVTIINVARHYTPNSPYSWERLDEMARAKEKVNKSRTIAHYSRSQPEQNSNEKKVRYHKHYQDKRLIWKTDREGRYLTGQEILGLYKDKDPILSQEVEIPMVRDAKSGQLRKKTLHERYNKTRRREDVDVRIKSERFNAMKVQELKELNNSAHDKKFSAKIE